MTRIPGFWISIPSLVGSFLIIGLTSAAHYQSATLDAESHTRIQCGHIVYTRAAQLLGLPLRVDELKNLPDQTNGVSFWELKQAFKKIGVDSTLVQDRKLLDKPLKEMVILKLVNPDHFILVKDGGSDHLLQFREWKRPVQISRSNVKKRFSGFAIRLQRNGNPITALASKQAQSLPQFDTLWNDRGNLDYVKYAGKSTPFHFKVVNAGSKDLVFTKSHASCDCTGIDMPTEPIPPGNSAEITVSYKSSFGNAEGNFHQSVTLETNSIDFPLVRLEVSGRFPDRLFLFPSRIEAGLTSGTNKTIRYFFVTVPESCQSLEKIKARFTDKEPVPALTMERSSFDEYDKAMRALDPGYIPIVRKPNVVVFKIIVDGKKFDQIGTFHANISVQHEDNELAPIPCYISGWYYRPTKPDN